MKELKYSRQREAILDNLRNRYDHPTADAIFQSLRNDNPKISLGTVYRNLGLLTELGKINRISCGDGIERYDYRTKEHSHFVCRKCSKVIDLAEDLEKNLNAQIVNDEIAAIDSHSLIFYGCCKDCYKKMLPIAQ